MAEREPNEPRNARRPKEPQRRGQGPDDEGDDEVERRGRGLPFFLLLVLVLIAVAQAISSRSTAPRIRYDQFKQAVRQGEVEEVQLGPELIRGKVRATRPAQIPAGQQIAPGTTPPPTTANAGRILSIPVNAGRGFHFETVRVGDDRELLPLLEQNNVRYEAIEDRQGAIFSILFFIGTVGVIVMAYRMLARRMQAQQSGVLAFGKSRG